jgi:regulator of RNase E activity RraA
MAAPTSLTPGQLADLGKLDTCLVANAIEAFNLRLRNEGFANSSIRCMAPQPTPMVGYAATLKIQCSHPPMSGHSYVDRTDWWDWLVSLPKPSILVIQDVDVRPGIGAFIGEMHAAIVQAMGCIGVVTNGSVRDVPAVHQRGFHLFAGSLAVSHAYAHKVEFGTPVTVVGLEIKTGNLLHGDQHGVLCIPPDIAAEVPSAAERIRAHEKRILTECESPDFSIEKLRDAVKGYFTH